LHLLVPAVFALGVLAACSQPRPAETSSSVSSSVPALAVDPSTAGSISGTVVLDGPPPVLRPINMDSEPACAAANRSPVFPPEVVTGKNGALANVVVFVKSGLANYHYQTPARSAVLDQKNCMYEPHIVALMTNQRLEIHNDDPTIHNVHSMPKINEGWNKAQRAGSAPLVTSFPRPELAIPFMCNVHPWMRSFIFVFDHPYFAVTSSNGAFSLKNLPPGTYTIEAWQEKYGMQDQRVTLAPRESKAVSFTFKSSSPSGE
jgi:Carboxypeptidase regulatory-like domain